MFFHFRENIHPTSIGAARDSSSPGKTQREAHLFRNSPVLPPTNLRFLQPLSLKQPPFIWVVSGQENPHVHVCAPLGGQDCAIYLDQGGIRLWRHPFSFFPEFTGDAPTEDFFQYSFLRFSLSFFYSPDFTIKGMFAIGNIISSFFWFFIRAEVASQGNVESEGHWQCGLRSRSPGWKFR